MWKSLQDALDRDALELGISIEITDELDPDRARSVYAAARAQPGCCALILRDTERLFETRVADELARYEQAPPTLAARPATALERALDQLGARTGAEPLAVLHRLDADTLQALERDDEGEAEDEDPLVFSPDLLGPDEPREAYAAFVQARQDARAAALGFGLVVDQAGPPHTYDLETAIAELQIGRARVVRLATTPARALLHLGFGGWNDCPSPHRQARTWEHWARTIGAEPAVLGADTLEAIVARPIATRDALVRTAAEVLAYDPDSVIEGHLPLLAMLYRNANLRFWWD